MFAKEYFLNYFKIKFLYKCLLNNSPKPKISLLQTFHFYLIIIGNNILRIIPYVLTFMGFTYYAKNSKRMHHLKSNLA